MAIIKTNNGRGRVRVKNKTETVVRRVGNAVGQLDIHDSSTEVMHIRSEKNTMCSTRQRTAWCGKVAIRAS